MHIVLAIFLMFVTACIGFLIGSGCSYSAGWDDGRNYTLDIYDKDQLEYEKKAKLAKKQGRYIL